MKLNEVLDHTEFEILSESAKEIANTIIQQMGGYGKLKAMIGAKDFIYSDKDGPSFKDLPYVKFSFAAKAKNGAKVFYVYYTKADTYTVEFWKKPTTKQSLNTDLKDWNKFMISRFEHVYAEDLKRIFEEETELYLSL